MKAPLKRGLPEIDHTQMSYDKKDRVLSLSLKNGKTKDDMIEAYRNGTLWAFVYESELVHQVDGYAINNGMNSTDVTGLLQKVVDDISKTKDRPLFIRSPVGYLRTSVVRALRPEPDKNRSDTRKKNSKKAPEETKKSIKPRFVEINNETLSKPIEKYHEDPRLRALDIERANLFKKKPLLAARIRFGLSLVEIDYDIKCLKKTLERDSKTKKEAAEKLKVEIKELKKLKGKKWLEFAKKHSPDKSPDKLELFSHASQSAFSNWKCNTLKKALTKVKI